MSTETLEDMDKNQLRETILAWETTAHDIGDALFRYLEKTGLREWTEIAEEGRTLYEAMFDTEVEEFSPIDDVIFAVAAQASDGMCASMAAMLGWDARMLGLVLSHWNEADENGEYKKETITLEELKALYEKEVEFWSKRDADH